MLLIKWDRGDGNQYYFCENENLQSAVRDILNAFDWNVDYDSEESNLNQALNNFLECKPEYGSTEEEDINLKGTYTIADVELKSLNIEDLDLEWIQTHI